MKSMKSIDERIADAEAEVNAVYLRGAGMGPDKAPLDRLYHRCLKRLADLEAVRDGRAIEVHSTIAVSGDGAWDSLGCSWNDAGDTVDSHSGRDVADMGDRLTILRGIACLPTLVAMDEVEAESEGT